MSSFKNLKWSLWDLLLGGRVAPIIPNFSHHPKPANNCSTAASLRAALLSARLGVSRRCSLCLGLPTRLQSTIRKGSLLPRTLLSLQVGRWVLPMFKQATLGESSCKVTCIVTNKALSRESLVFHFLSYLLPSQVGSYISFGSKSIRHYSPK